MYDNNVKDRKLNLCCCLSETDTRKVNVEADPDTPQISLEEMLDELNISEDATGKEGASMVE